LISGRENRGLKTRINFKRITALILISIIYTGLGGIAAMVISKNFDTKFQDVMTIAGFLSIIIGVVFSVKDRNVASYTENSHNPSYYLFLMDKLKNASYNKKDNDYFKSNILNLSFSKFILILGGLFLIGLSILFSL
jgi:hypothetical protein